MRSKTATIPAKKGIQALFEPISREIDRVESELKAQFNSHHEFIQDLLDHISIYRGKFLRPALALFAGKCCDRMTDDHVRLALICEMIHTASLVHDDIIDMAEMRRKVPTVNQRWTNEIAVLLGDYLFSQAFHLSCDFETNIASRELSRTTNVMVAGELLQAKARDCFDLTESRYLDIIGMKTAELCAASAKLGAIFSGAQTSVSRAFYDYGYNLGMAFQIIDDYLDILGEESRVGKSLGTDLGLGRATLPVIYALTAADTKDRRKLLNLLKQHSHETPVTLKKLIHDTGAAEYTLEKAKSLVGRAVSALTPLPDSPHKEQLCRLAYFVVARDF